MSLLTKVEIGGVDVSSYLINYEIEKTFGDEITEVEMEFVSSVNTAVTIDVGTTIEIWSGHTTSTDLKTFDGRIEKYEPEGGTIKIVGKDKIWDLVKKEVTYSYDSNNDASAGVISEIFKDLVTTHGGLNADATTIQDSGTAKTISKFICNHTDVFERCKALATALDWQFYYRADTDKVYFEPKGYTTNTTDLTIGSNVITVPEWKIDSSDMVNDLTITGAYQEVETTESGQIGTTSGYATTGITLTKTPTSVKLYLDAANPPTTLKTGGIEDSSSSYDYTVDKVNKKILPFSAFTNAHFAQVNYSYKIPATIRVYKQSSIDSYTTFKKTISLLDLRGTGDAETRGRDFLSKYSTPFKYTKLKIEATSDNDYQVGDLVTVTDLVNTPNVIEETFVINRLTIRYPGDYVSLYIGDREWRLAEWQSNVEERLKRIEEEQFQNQDVIVQYIELENDGNFKPRPRYFKLLKDVVDLNNSFILGHPTAGVLGTNPLGVTYDSQNVLQTLIQGNMTYEEYVYDTDFHDSGNSTATFTTGTNTISFTSGQVWRSEQIDLGSTLSYIKVTLGTTTGTLTIEISSDNGSTWQTVTDDTRTAVTTSDGTGTLVRITESNSSTASITNTTDSYSINTAPAIKVVMEV